MKLLPTNGVFVRDRNYFDRIDEKRRKEELKVGREIQMKMLPSRLPDSKKKSD